MPELSTEFIEELTKKLRAIGSLKAVGDTWVSFDSSVPPGGVPFCGQTVSRALYADLLTWATAQGKMKTEEEWQAYAAANGGNCPYYSQGDSLTTFRMPCVLGYLRGSSVTTEGGTYKPQKLPNLKGKARPRDSSGFFRSTDVEILYEGVFASGERVNSNYYLNITTGYPSDELVFNAHLYDERYEDGADVQPETFHVLVGVYAVGVITNINNTDVSQLQTGLATLEANTVKSVNNVTPVAGNVQIDEINNRWGKPNATIIEADSGVSFPYTAPENGVFYARTDSGTGGGILLNGNRVGNLDQFSSISVPFKKGDVINISGGTNNRKICLNVSDS